MEASLTEQVMPRSLFTSDPERAAASTVRVLTDALRRCGIPLTPLPDTPTDSGQARVHLGTCPAGTALRLAEALTATADTSSGAVLAGSHDGLSRCAVLIRPGHVVELDGQLNTITATHAAPLSTGVLHVTLRSSEGVVWRGPAGTAHRVVEITEEAGR